MCMVCVCVSFELVFPQQRHTQVAILFFYFFFPVSTLQRHYNVAQSGTLRTTHEMNVSWKFDSRANVIAVINEKKKMAELNDLRRRRLIKTHIFCLVSFN